MMYHRTWLLLLVAYCAMRYTIADEASFLRTVVMMRLETYFGQNLFIRGGLDYSRRQGCDEAASVETNPCVIRIRYTRKLSDKYAAATNWSIHDRFLDWAGAEPSQGTWDSHKAEGSPAIWTTNDSTSDYYHELNNYGDHVWILDVDMDCSKTQDGYFELKGFIDGSWEGDIDQGACSGSEGAAAPFKSTNHVAKCGAINVFTFNNAAQCEIKPSDTPLPEPMSEITLN